MRNLMRAKLVAVIVGSILLLGLGFTYFFMAAGTRGFWGGGSALVLALIISFAAGAVAWATAAKIAIDRKTARLDAAAKAAFEIIRAEVRDAPLTIKEKRDLEDEVLDLLLSSQAEGRRAADAIGGDAAAFARRMLEAMGVRKPPLVWLADAVMYFIAFAAATQLVNALETPGIDFFAAPVGLPFIVLYAVLSMARGRGVRRCRVYRFPERFRGIIRRAGLHRRGRRQSQAVAPREDLVRLSSAGPAD